MADYRSRVPSYEFPEMLSEQEAVLAANPLLQRMQAARSKGGRTSWANIATACSPCNLKKGGRMLKESGLHIARLPERPSNYQLQEMGRRFPPNHLHETWMDYLYWDVELEA